jgi:hypothetical protein
VAKPLGAASSRVKPFLSGSTSAGTVKERVYAKDDMALRRAPPPPSEDASSDARSWTRSLFDDYVLFFPQEMAGLVARMPRLYEVFLQVRGVEDADEAKRRVLEMSAWSGSRR